MNWQNVNSDPTWASIDNWYWRSWEVCIGIVAASIPALRPGYKALSSSLQSFCLHRSTRESSAFDPLKEGHPLTISSDEGALSRHMLHLATQHNRPHEAAIHAALAEADRGVNYGVGEESYAMKALPGDKNLMSPGIKKTTRIDLDIENERSLELDGYERYQGGRSLV